MKSECSGDVNRLKFLVLVSQSNPKVSHVHSTLSLRKSSLQVKHLLPDLVGHLKIISHFNGDF